MEDKRNNTVFTYDVETLRESNKLMNTFGICSILCVSLRYE